MINARQEEKGVEIKPNLNQNLANPKIESKKKRRIDQDMIPNGETEGEQEFIPV